MHSLNRLYLVGWDLLIKYLLNINTHSNSSAEATDPREPTDYLARRNSPQLKSRIPPLVDRTYLAVAVDYIHESNNLHCSFIRLIGISSSSSSPQGGPTNDDTRAEEDASRSHIHHRNRDWLTDWEMLHIIRANRVGTLKTRLFAFQ